ncbi:hypothetical protein T31B1_14504 [Salinisphaera sp. T31B1]
MLVFYAERVLEETPMTFDALAEAIAIEYERRVPAHARSVKLAAPSSSDYRTFAKELGAVSTRTKRYIRGGMLIPSDLEEAIAYALPAPYGLQCRRALARRYGFLGAVSPQSEAAPSDAEALSSICADAGGVIRSVGEALADGRLDADDIALAPLMIRQLHDLMSDAASAIKRIEDRTGYRAPRPESIRTSPPTVIAAIPTGRQTVSA